MSSQKGNTRKQGPPKHQNKTAFKNSLFDTSKKIKQINDVQTSGVCKRCKDIVDWKIKYKKYKPLTQPRKCTRCFEKKVKQAYYIICMPCASKLQVCAKCGDKKIIISEPELPEAEQAVRDAELKFELGQLKERERRTFLRLQEQGKLGAGTVEGDGDLERDGDLEGDGVQKETGSEMNSTGTGGMAERDEDMRSNNSGSTLEHGCTIGATCEGDQDENKEMPERFKDLCITSQMLDNSVSRLNNLPDGNLNEDVHSVIESCLDVLEQNEAVLLSTG